MKLRRFLVGTLSEEADGLLLAVFDHLEVLGRESRDDAAAAVGDGYAEMRQVGFGAEDSLRLLRVGGDERRHQSQGNNYGPRHGADPTPTPVRWRHDTNASPRKKAYQTVRLSQVLEARY